MNCFCNKYFGLYYSSNKICWFNDNCCNRMFFQESIYFKLNDELFSVNKKNGKIYSYIEDLNAIAISGMATFKKIFDLGDQTLRLSDEDATVVIDKFINNYIFW